MSLILSPNMTASKSLLPLVTKNIVDTVQALMAKNYYVEEVCERIKRYNPYVSECIIGYSLNHFYRTRQSPEEMLYVAVSMYAMLEKSGDIPIVSGNAYNTLVASAREEREVWFDRLLTHIQNDNPHLDDFLRQFADKSQSPRATLGVGVSVYALLESQAEADKLKLEFNVQ